MLARTDYKEVPPRVDYALTPLGRSLAEAIVPLGRWRSENAEEMATSSPNATLLPRNRQRLNAKSPQLSGLQGFLLVATGQRRTHHHSHSIVAGGLLDTSYVTREMPSISLMIRPETVSSSSYGRCAQRAVMKSMVSTARRATTQA